MNMNQPANIAETSTSLKKEREAILENRILKERKSNSSIASAGLLIGVHPKVIEAYLPELLEASKKYNEQNKTK